MKQIDLVNDTNVDDVSSKFNFYLYAYTFSFNILNSLILNTPTRIAKRFRKYRIPKTLLNKILLQSIFSLRNRLEHGYMSKDFCHIC